MLRLVALAILPLLVLSAGALGLVLAAPAPPDRLVEQVLHEGCEGASGSCWYGIVPGVTTFQEAIERLRQHPWIGAIDISEMPSPYVSWLWKPDAPAAVRGGNAPAGGYAWVGYPVYHQIEGVHVWTALPVASFWLALGPPDEAGDAVGVVNYRAGYTGADGGGRVLASAFQHGTLVLHSGFPCSVTAREFFSAPAAISVYVQAPRTLGGLQPGGLREWLYGAACGG